MKWYWYLIVTLFVFWFLAIATPISIGKYRGESMVPVFKNGELLVLLKAKPAGIKIKKGMIVGYKDGKEKESIIHRVISVQEGKIITQGDNNPEPDKTISDSDVIGVYLFKIPYSSFFGKFSDLMQKKMAGSFSTGWTINIFLLSFWWMIIRRKNSKNK